MSISKDAMPRKHAPGNARLRSSAVSQALRALGDGDAAPGPESEAGPRLRVANDEATRACAYRLAYDLYRAKGYVGELAEGRLVAPWDRAPDTLTLLAGDDHGDAVATVSLVFDAANGLPCDAVFGDVLAELRAKNRRIVEVTRLAIGEAHLCSRQLLVRLFNWIYIHARRVRRCDDFVIEVNPRHVSYYRRLLGFEVLGEARPCPRVLGAPAVLLRLDLAYPEGEVQRVGGTGAAAGERSLYPYFLTDAAELSVERLLRRQHRPMSSAEAQRFGLAGVAAKRIAATA
ncbi:MAG: hypothetical protein L6R28_10075 [Planctomycetes bacterium]|nr:hypothetical protein [Planctomycetota bacterium]